MRQIERPKYKFDVSRHGCDIIGHYACANVRQAALNRLTQVNLVLSGSHDVLWAATHGASLLARSLPAICAISKVTADTPLIDRFLTMPETMPLTAWCQPHVHSVDQAMHSIFWSSLRALGVDL